jgi:hypothetical protein
VEEMKRFWRQTVERDNFSLWKLRRRASRIRN